MTRNTDNHEATDRDARLDLPGLERRAREHWERNGVFARSLAARRGAEPWTFFEGPPTANGMPGVHHAMARSFKDLYARFRTMQGYYVERRAGWDCHGLPVELETEKRLGLEGKEEVTEFGVAAFNEECRGSVEHYVGRWCEMTARLGFWLDTEDAYWTMSPRYVEGVWSTLAEVFRQGRLYKGAKVTPHCPRCETTLSSHELAQGYAEREDLTAYVGFPLADGSAELVAWTTTPWTLPANKAVACSTDLRYACVAVDGRKLVVEESAAPALFPGARVLGTFTGEDLVGRLYETPFGEGGCPVLAADLVKAGEGTGLVHVAPAHGVEDAALGAEVGLDHDSPVGADGRYVGMEGFDGCDVLEAQEALLSWLEALGHWVRRERLTHRYPHCWRCGTPLLNMSKASWYVSTSDKKERMAELNAEVGWHPGHAGSGRFNDWLAGNVDWAVSRERFWGTPLPLWVCGAGHVHCVASLAELEDLSGVVLEDPHRPFVDEVFFSCTAEGCEAEMRRTPEVLDVWWDSGAMPVAAGAPGTSPPVADFVCEGLDQTRGWFYALHAVSTLLFDRAPFRNVLCLGLVLDGEGKKMSKSKGNTVDPFELFDELGADALRWYFLTSKSPWEGYRFSTEEVRDHLSTLESLWSCLHFYESYEEDAGVEGDRTGELLDAWLETRLQALTGTMTAALENFYGAGAGGALAEFVEDLSNWYLRQSRRRFWNGEPGAFRTLRRCLLVLSRLLAPFCPHLAEEMHRRLGGAGDSVHLLDWPKADASLRDLELEAEMEKARRLVALSARVRAGAGLPLRQPLRRGDVSGLDRESLVPLLEQAMNVKHLGLGSVAHLLKAKPNFPVLGPRLGAGVKDLARTLAAASQQDLSLLESGGELSVELHGETLTLSRGDVLLTNHAQAGYGLETDGQLAVALELELDQELLDEGLYRHVLRTLQEMRRERGLEVSDRVSLSLSGDPDTVRVLRAFEQDLACELLADLEVTEAPAPGNKGVELGEGACLFVLLQEAPSTLSRA